MGHKVSEFSTPPLTMVSLLSNPELGGDIWPYFLQHVANQARINFGHEATLAQQQPNHPTLSPERYHAIVVGAAYHQYIGITLILISPDLPAEVHTTTQKPIDFEEFKRYKNLHLGNEVIVHKTPDGYRIDTPQVSTAESDQQIYVWLLSLVFPTLLQ